MGRERTTRKRVEILRSAAAAFRRRGYHGASVDEIARALHMTKGNLYYYFESKEEILYFCHDYSLDILLRLLDEACQRTRCGQTCTACLPDLVKYLSSR